MHLKSRSWILIGLLFAALAISAHAQIITTTVADTIYQADGTPATGSALISWPAFTTVNGDSIPSGSTSATISASGQLSVALIPNAGATPIGTYYTVVYHLGDGSVSRQYWVVPASSAPVKIAAIESTVLPTSVAMQTVSKSYVDTAIAAAVTGHPLDTSPYVLKAGDTMTGPLSLPADPVSATQAADKNYVDETVAALTGGLGQAVSTNPSATQVVTQPAGTQLDVNRLNGVADAGQYVTGSGNNGIANAAASPDCANGCKIEAPQDYGGEKFSPTTFNNQTHVSDARGGRQADSYFNPLDTLNHGLSTAQAIDDVSTQSEASMVQEIQNSDPGAVALAITQEGWAGGNNIFPEQIEYPPYFKMNYSALSVTGTYTTQGQHVLVPEQTDCFGVGDCLMGARFLYASGGFRDSADEGAHPFDLQTHEDTRVFAGFCLSGCSAGSTSVTISATANGGTQGDGRFLIDTNPTQVITNASSGGQLIGGAVNGPHPSAQFSGTSFPVSVFLSAGQTIPSQSTDMAPGTVTFSIATSGVPSGYATSTVAISARTGLACIVDQTNNYAPDDYEMAPYTVIDATHLQMTLNKPHQLLATIAIGGLCGYGLEQTVDTANGIRQLFPVVGSNSATSLYYAGGITAVVGQMNQTSGFLNVGAPIASATRSGNLVSVVTSSSIPANINGLTAAIAGVADSSYNGSYVVTTTGTNSFTYAQTGANSSSTGGAVSVLTGGFALYPMAEVLSVYDNAARGVDGLMTLAPNSVAWAANDPVEQPHFYQERVSADTEFVGQSVPRPTVTQSAGLQYQQNNGPGLIGWSIANAAPTSNYLGYGGTHGFPYAAYQDSGIWQRDADLVAGEQAVFTIHCNLHGCANWNSGYNLFEMDSSAGGDTVAYNPSTSALSLGLRGSGYTFTPQAFTAGTINVGTINASAINAPGIGGGVQLAGDLGGTASAPAVTGIQGHAVASGTPATGQALVWAGSNYQLTSVPTLDANGRIIPGGSAYGGVLGNDASGGGYGPAMFSNGYQVATFQTFDSGGGATLLLGLTPGGHPWDGSNINFYGGAGCNVGSINFNSGDGAVIKNAGGCNNPMASLMLGTNGTDVDIEPDSHMKMHTNAGSSSYAPPVSFTGGAGASNCGTGAVFDPGSNDGAGRIVVGSTPPSVCRVTWQHTYAQVAGGSPQTGGWANSAPVCSVANEGHRATATIVFNSNPNPGDTITIEGQTWRFWTSVANSNDVQIGATAADTANTFFTWYLVHYDAPANPGSAPGVDPATTHYMYSMPTSTSIALTYFYMDGVTGNSVALSTTNSTAIALPASLSGGALPSTRSVVAQAGIGGMAITAPGGSLAAGDVLAYSCIAYW